MMTGWWFGTWLLFFHIFPYIGNFRIPTDFHIFQRGWNHQPDNLYGYIYIWIILSHFIVNPWVNAWLNITYIRIILSHSMFSTHGKTYHGLTSHIFVSKKSQVPIDLAPFWWMAFQLVMSYVNWSYVQIIYPQLTMVDKQGVFNLKIWGLCWYTGIVSLRLTRMMFPSKLAIKHIATRWGLPVTFVKQHPWILIVLGKL